MPHFVGSSGSTHSLLGEESPYFMLSLSCFVPRMSATIVSLFLGNLVNYPLALLNYTFCRLDCWLTSYSNLLLIIHCCQKVIYITMTSITILLCGGLPYARHRNPIGSCFILCSSPYCFTFSILVALLVMTHSLTELVAWVVYIMVSTLWFPFYLP